MVRTHSRGGRHEAGRPKTRSAQRSSARSGDSGSDEPGESDPPAAACCNGCGAELAEPHRDESLVAALHLIGDYCRLCLDELSGRKYGCCCPVCGESILHRAKRALSCGKAACQKEVQRRRLAAVEPEAPVEWPSSVLRRLEERLRELDALAHQMCSNGFRVAPCEGLPHEWEGESGRGESMEHERKRLASRELVAA